MNPVIHMTEPGHGAPTVPARTATVDIIAIKERKMSLLEYELSRARIHDIEREMSLGLDQAVRVRAVRRARRDARVRALRLSRILLAR
jgi:hypothetical protein